MATSISKRIFGADLNADIKFILEAMGIISEIGVSIFCSNFSQIKINGLYDLKKEINTEYNLGYSYFDECFGINIDYKRSYYADNDLKPKILRLGAIEYKKINTC